MRYYKQTQDSYITAVGTGPGSTEITADEYFAILKAIQNKPTPPDGKGYRLTTDMAFEEYDLPAVDDDPELSDAEALDIILGGEI